LEFLADVIPKTTTYKQYKEKRAKEAAKYAVMEKGQRKLNGGISANGTHRSTPGSQSVLQLSNRSHPSAGTQPTVVPHSPGSHSTVIVPRRADTSGQVNEDADVEMTG
jgi:DNA-directed RNA polymerase I subunit RPA43